MTSSNFSAQRAVLLALALAAIAGMGPALGCDCNCDPPEPFESGDYTIVSPASEPVFPGDEWVLGGALHVDREAHFATIRYTFEGTTYEVRYTLEQ